MASNNAKASHSCTRGQPSNLIDLLAIKFPWESRIIAAKPAQLISWNNATSILHLRKDFGGLCQREQVSTST